MQSGTDKSRDEAVAESTPPWSQRRQAVNRLLRRGLPFFVTIVVVFVGFWLYNLLVPPPEPMTTMVVEEIVDGAFAAATPPPAHSTSVYQTILPSLVIIKSSGVAPQGDSTARTDASSRKIFDEIGLDHNVLGRGVESFVPVSAGVRVGEKLWPRHSGSMIAGYASPEVRGEDAFAIGSGVVINDGGAILTALHIVEQASDIEITFADGTVTGAQIIAVQPDNNIAVLQPELLPELFAAATLGNPNALRVGDEAYAVGNPLGLAGSISAGVISGFDRTYRSPNHDQQLERLIQFDAAVNLGNSGGPLLNRNGEVVGIVVGLINPTAQETFIGIGLAVRIDVAGRAAGAPNQ